MYIVTTEISADQRLMVALLLIPAILSQNSIMLDKASQASCVIFNLLKEFSIELII